MSKVLLKLENVMHKGRWSQECYRKIVLSKQEYSSQFFFGFFKNFFLVHPDFTKVGHFLN